MNEKFLFEFTEDEMRLLCASTNVMACLSSSKNREEAQKFDALYKKLMKPYAPYIRKVINDNIEKFD